MNTASKKKVPKFGDIYEKCLNKRFKSCLEQIRPTSSYNSENELSHRKFISKVKPSFLDDDKNIHDFVKFARKTQSNIKEQNKSIASPPPPPTYAVDIGNWDKTLPPLCDENLKKHYVRNIVDIHFENDQKHRHADFMNDHTQVKNPEPKNITRNIHSSPPPSSVGTGITQVMEDKYKSETPNWGRVGKETLRISSFPNRIESFPISTNLLKHHKDVSESPKLIPEKLNYLRAYESRIRELETKRKKVLSQRTARSSSRFVGNQKVVDFKSEHPDLILKNTKNSMFPSRQENIVITELDENSDHSKNDVIEKSRNSIESTPPSFNNKTWHNVLLKNIKNVDKHENLQTEECPTYFPSDEKISTERQISVIYDSPRIVSKPKRNNYKNLQVKNLPVLSIHGGNKLQNVCKINIESSIKEDVTGIKSRQIEPSENVGYFEFIYNEPEREGHKIGAKDFTVVSHSYNVDNGRLKSSQDTVFDYGKISVNSNEVPMVAGSSLQWIIPVSPKNIEMNQNFGKSGSTRNDNNLNRTFEVKSNVAPHSTDHKKINKYFAPFISPDSSPAVKHANPTTSWDVGYESTFEDYEASFRSSMSSLNKEIPETFDQKIKPILSESRSQKIAEKDKNTGEMDFRNVSDSSTPFKKNNLSNSDKDSSGSTNETINCIIKETLSPCDLDESSVFGNDFRYNKSSSDDGNIILEKKFGNDIGLDCNDLQYNRDVSTQTSECLRKYSSNNDISSKQDDKNAVPVCMKTNNETRSFSPILDGFSQIRFNNHEVIKKNSTKGIDWRNIEINFDLYTFDPDKPCPSTSDVKAAVTNGYDYASALVAAELRLNISRDGFTGSQNVSMNNKSHSQGSVRNDADSKIRNNCLNAEHRRCSFELKDDINTLYNTCFCSGGCVENLFLPRNIHKSNCNVKNNISTEQSSNSNKDVDDIPFPTVKETTKHDDPEIQRAVRKYLYKQKFGLNKSNRKVLATKKKENRYHDFVRDSSTSDFDDIDSLVTDTKVSGSPSISSTTNKSLLNQYSKSDCTSSTMDFLSGPSISLKKTMIANCKGANKKPNIAVNSTNFCKSNLKISNNMIEKEFTVSPSSSLSSSVSLHPSTLSLSSFLPNLSTISKSENVLRPSKFD